MTSTRSAVVGGGLLARNTMINALGHALPLLVAVLAIPAVVRGLGEDRFGVLTLAWILLGYFAVFDLGLGRAATKFVAEALGRDDRASIPTLVWTAILVQTVFGVVTGGVVALATPVAIDRFFAIPDELAEQTRLSFLLLAASVPVVLVSGSLRGILEAAQRFDLTNAVKVPSACASYLLPLLGLALGLDLAGIIALLLAARAVALVVLAILCQRVFPGLLRNPSIRWEALRKLAGFGGWVMATSVTIPVLMYLERALITSMVSVGALTFYNVPYEMLSRLAFFPASLALTLFPAFSFAQAHGRAWLEELIARPVKYTVLLVTPVLLFIAVFASELLELWFDTDFAAESARTLQILTGVFFVNAFAQIPFAAVQGLGRPDLKVKLDLLEIPFFALLCWMLIPGGGIVGAAWAKFGVALIDAVGLFWLAHRVGGVRARAVWRRDVLAAFLAAGLFAVLAALGASLTESLVTVLGVFALGAALFALAFWRWATDERDRLALARFVERVRPVVPRG